MSTPPTPYQPTPMAAPAAMYMPQPRARTGVVLSWIVGGLMLLIALLILLTGGSSSYGRVDIGIARIMFGGWCLALSIGAFIVALART